MYCGGCAFCRRGDVNLCDARNVLGVSCADYRRHGAFAEFIAVPARILYPLPATLPFEQAAMVEALAIAVHAVERRRPAVSDRVAVVGCGMIGLLTIQVLRAYGIDSIVGADLDAGRRQLATQAGAERAVESLSGEPPFDHAFEAVGVAAAVTAAIGAVRKGGGITLIGNLAPEVPLPLQAVVTRELTLFGSCASKGEYPAAIELLASGAVDVAPLISAVAPLEEGQSWFDRLHRADEGLMKVVLTP